jgi:MFS family permease
MLGVSVAVLVTTLWAMGGYTVYTYVASYLQVVTGIRGALIGWVLFTWGIGAALGVFSGGALNDRFGNRPVIVATLSIMAFAFVSLSLTARYLTPSTATTCTEIDLDLVMDGGNRSKSRPLARLSRTIVWLIVPFRLHHQGAFGKRSTLEHNGQSSFYLASR